MSGLRKALKRSTAVNMSLAAVCLVLFPFIQTLTDMTLLPYKADFKLRVLFLSSWPREFNELVCHYLKNGVSFRAWTKSGGN